MTCFEYYILRKVVLKSVVYSKIRRKIKESPHLIQATYYNAVAFQSAMKFFVQVKDNMNSEIFYITELLIVLWFMLHFQRFQELKCQL